MKMGFPKIMAMILIMTTRYSFFFFDELNNIRNAQKSRAFDIQNKKISYIWRLKQIELYTITSIFKIFWKRRKLYFSMISREYTVEAISYYRENTIH